MPTGADRRLLGIDGLHLSCEGAEELAKSLEAAKESHQLSLCQPSSQSLPDCQPSISPLPNCQPSKSLLLDCQSSHRVSVDSDCKWTSVHPGGRRWPSTTSRLSSAVILLQGLLLSQRSLKQLLRIGYVFSN